MKSLLRRRSAGLGLNVCPALATSPLKAMSVGGASKTAFHQVLPALCGNRTATLGLGTYSRRSRQVGQRLRELRLGTAELRLQKRWAVHRSARFPNLIQLLNRSDYTVTSDKR